VWHLLHPSPSPSTHIGSVIFACFKIHLPEAAAQEGGAAHIQDSTPHSGLVTSRFGSAPPHPPSFSDHDLDPALYSATSRSTPKDRLSVSPPVPSTEPHYHHMSAAIVSANAAPHSQSSSASASTTTAYPAHHLYSYDSPHPPASYDDESNPSLPPISASMNAHHAQNQYYIHPPQYGSSTQYGSRPYEYHHQQPPPHWQSSNSSSHMQQATPRSAQTSSTYLVGPGEYPQPGNAELYYARHDISPVADTAPSTTVESAVDEYTSPAPPRSSHRGSEGRQSPEMSSIPSSSKPKSASNRPAGVQQCSSCKATSSPEWRKGPSGKKELCNA